LEGRVYIWSHLGACRVLCGRQEDKEISREKLFCGTKNVFLNMSQKMAFFHETLYECIEYVNEQDIFKFF
jgi:hypothetical protein